MEKGRANSAGVYEARPGWGEGAASTPPRGASEAGALTALGAGRPLLLNTEVAKGNSFGGTAAMPPIDTQPARPGGSPEPVPAGGGPCAPRNRERRWTQPTIIVPVVGRPKHRQRSSSVTSLASGAASLQRPGVSEFGGSMRPPSPAKAG